MNRLEETLRKSGKYYSAKCFSEKFHIYRNGFEVSRDQYDRMQDNEIPNCKITIDKNYAELKYNNIKFTICDGEFLTVAEGLMKKAFKGNITIAFFYNNKIVSKTNKINSNLYYKIKIECQFAFKDIKGSVYYSKMDYNAKVSDATKTIPLLFEYGMVLSSDITILDENKKPITDKYRTLNSIPEFDKAIFISISDKSMFAKVKAGTIYDSLAKDCYGEVNGVTKYLVSEGLFYTEKCFKSNLHFYKLGTQIQPCNFKYMKEIKKSQVEIRLSGKCVTLDYDGKKFIAQEDDTVKTIVELVKKACKYAINIVVSKIDNNQKLQKLQAQSLFKRTDKYAISSQFKFKFKNMKGSDSIQVLDYTSTVADGKNRLSLIYGNNPGCIVICDDNKDEITDLAKQLNTIPNYTKQIYFDIDYNLAKLPPPSSPSQKEVPSIKTKPELKSSDETPPSSPKSKSKPTKTTKSPQNSFDDDDKISPSGENNRPAKSQRPKIKKPVLKYTTDDDTTKPSQPVKSSSPSSPKKTSRNSDSVGFSPSEDSEADKIELIEINFVFDKNNDKKYYSFKKKLKSDMTMKEVEEMIAEKYEIDDRISINSKEEDGELTQIGSRTTIESNLDDICETVNGKSKYYLYIKITKRVNFGSIEKGKKNSGSAKLSQSTKNVFKKPLIRYKKISDSGDDDDYDEPKNSKVKQKIKYTGSFDDEDEVKPKKPKPKQKYTGGFDDDDEIKPKKPKPKTKYTGGFDDDDDYDEEDEVKPKKTKPKPKQKYTGSFDDDDDDDEDSSEKKSRSKFSPSKASASLRPMKGIKEKVDKNSFEYGFVYGGKMNLIVLRNNSTLKENEAKIKEKLRIDDDEKIDFFIDDEEIESDETKMKSLKDDVINVLIHPKKKKQSKSKSSESSDDESKKFTYAFQTNKDEEEHTVELPAEATVQNLKKVIADMYDVDNFSNIKIIFAGKNLLSNLVLKDLEIEDTVIFAYIRTLDDILLMTAKANAINDEYD